MSLPRNDDGDIITSAIYGQRDVVVEVEYNTHADGAEVLEGDETPRTLHGPFASMDEADEWMNNFCPDDTDIAEVRAFFLNAVRPDPSRTITEWGFVRPAHPGNPEMFPEHVETSWTGGDGWTTGPYTEENVDFWAGGKPVMKRQRTITPDVVTEWVPR